ncbi:MAG: tRNA glutamyl-Q(34) synthetase GluQRS, partial [Candidatus Obscuribacterales bacterium]|nr:tRNA glutamyl-Q(34) synthetase GluQRS [Steroidobacteraceae bacterium]
DDAAQHITDVVRGADLLDSTARQILLQRALGLPTPRYGHLPLAIDQAGRKLSKSTQSLAVDLAKPNVGLWEALAFLQQTPPQTLRTAPVGEIWEWAKANWTPQRLQGIKSLTAPAPYIS